MRNSSVDAALTREEFLAAILDEGAPPRQAASAARLLCGGYDPTEPRDWRGRWTDGGSGDDYMTAMTDDSLGQAGATSEEGLRRIVSQFRASPAGKKLYLEAQKALSADKRYRGRGSLMINLYPDPKTLPRPNITTQSVPDVGGPNASNAKMGTIWVDGNDPRDNVFETLLVELAHIAQRSNFINLIDNAGATLMTS